MPLSNPEFQDVVQLCRQVFGLLHRIQGGTPAPGVAVDAFNASFLLDNPFQTLLERLRDAGTSAAREGDSNLEAGFLGLRACLLELCGEGPVMGNQCYLRAQREPSKFKKAVRLAQGKARALGLLEVSGRIQPRQESLPHVGGVAEESSEPGSTSTGGKPSSDGEGGPRFRRNGDYWEVAFEGGSTSVKSSKGMEYIACLLGRPNPPKPIAASQLSRIGGGSKAQPPSMDEDLGNVETSFQPVLDKVAKAACEKRLREIDEDLSVAQKNNDLGTTSRLQNEKGQILEELRKARGLRGKDRGLGARSWEPGAANAVSQALERAYKSIETRQVEGLAPHLRASIKREGSAFAYRPGPQPPLWEL